MADYRKIIPFIFHFASGLRTEHAILPLEEQFELARKTGWSNDPDDPGGATMIDVTLKTYAAYRKEKGIYFTDKRDLRNISFIEWKEILKRKFWDTWRADEIISQGIAHLLVDWVWASGPRSIRAAQQIIGVKADGKVGNITLGALNKLDSEEIFFKFYKERRRYYSRCRGSWKYLRGWLRRLDAIKSDGSFSF